MATALLHDPLFQRHLTEGPEWPERLLAIDRGLKEAGLLEKLVRVKPREATEEELRLVHPQGYIDRVKREIENGARSLSTGDTDLSEESLVVAKHATGGVLALLDLIVEGKVQNGFCATRPPGHHALPERGMGFCIFNHMAIAVRYAQTRHGLEKVLIVDWDVHHGNGTQATFYDDPTVLFFSTHQWPLYPGTGHRSETGRGEGLGYTINAPLPAGSGYRRIIGEIEKRLEPKLDSFRPELILISAGFDSRIGDPLGRFTVEDEEFAALTKRVMAWADTHCNGRVLSILEGGYNLETLGGAVAAHVGELMTVRGAQE